MKTTKLSVTGTLALALTAAAAHAQAPPSPLVDRRSHSFPWPTDLGPQSSFGRGVAGDVTGDLVPDAVVLMNETPYLIAGPAQYASVTSIPASGADIALLSIQSDAPLLVVAGSSALELWEFDASSSQWSLLNAEPAYAGARAIQSVDLDASGTDDLLVVPGDGRSVLPLIVDPLDPRSITAGSPIQLHSGAEDAVRIETVEWDGTPPLEVAVLTANHLMVLDDVGVVLEDAMSVYTGSPMSMAVVDRPSDGRQSIAWMTEGIFHTQWVTVVDETGIASPVDLGSFPTSWPSAADYDGDGDDDLFLGPEEDGHVYMLTGLTPELPVFVADPTLNLRFPLEEGSGGSTDRTDLVIAADFDNDGDADVLTVDEALEEVRFVRGEAVDERELLYKTSSGSLSCETGFLTLDLTAPASAIPNADVLEVRAFARPDPLEGIESVPYHTEDVPLAPSPTSVSVPIPEFGEGVDTTYFIELRVVSIDPTTGEERGWPAYPLLFTSDENEASVALDEDLGPEFQPTLVGCTSGFVPFGNAVKGSCVAPLPVIRPFREGEVPGGDGDGGGD